MNPLAEPLLVASCPATRRLPASRSAPTWRGHLQIARVDHWIKNLAVLPGIMVAVAAHRASATWSLAWPILIGLASTCLISSSNYVLNEVLDAAYDKRHPLKRLRPVPAGSVSVPLAYVQWLTLAAAGLTLAATVSGGLSASMAALWVMGCIYNIPPVRSKEVAYLDVLSEAINNPLRMLAGWFMVCAGGLPPVSLLASYWMIGCYFMAIKRLAEYQQIGSRRRAAAYRRSFAHYNPRRLMLSVAVYAFAAMATLGVFIARYRLELILCVPLIVAVMGIYLNMGFKADSAAAAPEKLHREPLLMAAVILCAIVTAALMVMDLPLLHRILAPLVASG